MGTVEESMLALTVKSSDEQPAVNVNLSTPLELIGRSAEFQQIVEILARDGDLLIAGVPGSGRRTLVRDAAQEVGAIVLEVDCIRATDGQRFLQLLAEAISQNFENGWQKQVVNYLLFMLKAMAESLNLCVLSIKSSYGKHLKC
jgi:Cdc6-like AAA superfamily ATPase